MSRDWRGRELACLTPRAYPDARMPDGIRFEACRRNTCVVCAPQKILSLAHAIALSPLSQAGFITLATFDDPLEAARRLRQGANAAFRWLHREHGLTVPRATIVELSPTGRPHVHVLTRKPAVPPRLFTEACSSAGMGLSNIEAVRRPPIALSRYLYKTVLPAFGEPLVADEGDLASFLELNGNRLIGTRGAFWLDREGTVLDGSVEAMKAARRQRRRPKWGEPQEGGSS